MNEIEQARQFALIWSVAWGAWAIIAILAGPHGRRFRAWATRPTQSFGPGAAYPRVKLPRGVGPL